MISKNFRRISNLKKITVGKDIEAWKTYKNSRKIPQLKKNLKGLLKKLKRLGALKKIIEKFFKLKKMVDNAYNLH